MNRAARHEAMFRDDVTCALFLDTVAEVPERFGARIHGYALMPNHYHLLVEVPRGNLSDVMKHIGATFTQAFNREHEHDGPVFRGRFRNRLVEDDAYWMHLLAYLHLNPVRAHLAARPQDCLWTSHNAYVDPAQAPGWLTWDAMLALFGSAAALEDYVTDVHLKRRAPPSSFEPSRLWTPSVTAVEPRPEPQLRTAEQALAEVAAVTGTPLRHVRDLPRGRRPNRTAWVAVWWLQRSTGLSQPGIGEVMGVSRSRVSQLLAKFYRLAKADPEVAGWSEALETRLEQRP